MIAAITGLSISLQSWGFKGHKAVVTIAQKRSTSNTANVVTTYLKGETMTDVSTWTNENGDKTTTPWYY